jgi:hypothetical protein
MSSTSHYGDDPVSRRSLWYGFFAAGAAFSLEGFIGYTISSRACFIGQGSLGPISPAGVRWLLVGITVVMFALAVSGLLLSYRNWRQLSNSELTRAEGNRPREFIALSGFLISSMMSLGIVWCGFIFIFVDVCMREH